LALRAIARVLSMVAEVLDVAVEMKALLSLKRAASMLWHFYLISFLIECVLRVTLRPATF
jgi:hypothetical protein